MRQLWTKTATGIAALLAATAIGLGNLPAHAQQRMIPIPPKAQRADITFNGTPDILVDGKLARLAPGARITDRSNMLVLPGTLKGVAKTKYTVEDTTGLIMLVWLLTEQEIATPDPKP
jgi:hypothetical protein